MRIPRRTICGLFATAILLLMLAGCDNKNSAENNEILNRDTLAPPGADSAIGTGKMLKGPLGNLYVDDGGSGGVPIIFIHSFGGSTLHWENQLAHLRSSRRAIAFDMGGHGHSTIPVDYNNFVQSAVHTIEELASALNLDKFILVGHSMGGSAAIAYAGKHPEKVAGLLLTGTPGKSPAEESKKIITSLESPQYETVMANYLNKLLDGAAPATDELEREGVKKLSKESSIGIIRSIFNYDPLPDLANYPGPKMIIDKTGEDQSHSLHKAFPAIPYTTVPGTSHWIQLDKPGEFNKLLDEFMKNIKP